MAITRAYKNATNFQERKTATPLIINGDMGIWQRGTALSSSPGSYACDRFWYAGTGATSQRSTDVPSGKGFIYSNKLTYSSADMAIGQPIELPATGKQGNLISGQTLTVAFYGKVDSGTEGIGTAINFRNGKFDGTDQQAFTISDNAVTLTTSWQRFTKTFTIPTVHANNIMAAFELNGISKTAYITGVQAEIGTFDADSIPPFQFEDRATSLNRCMRYYERNQGTGSNREYFSVGIKRDSYSGSDTTVSGIMTYKVRKRATPTIGYNGATSFVYTHGVSGATNFSSINIQNIGLDHARFHGELSSTTANSGGIIARREETDKYYDIDSEL